MKSENKLTNQYAPQYCFVHRNISADIEAPQEKDGVTITLYFCARCYCNFDLTEDLFKTYKEVSAERAKAELDSMIESPFAGMPKYFGHAEFIISPAPLQ